MATLSYDFAGKLILKKCSCLHFQNPLFDEGAFTKNAKTNQGRQLWRTMFLHIANGLIFNGSKSYHSLVSCLHETTSRSTGLRRFFNLLGQRKHKLAKHRDVQRDQPRMSAFSTSKPYECLLLHPCRRSRSSEKMALLLRMPSSGAPAPLSLTS